MKKDKNIKKLKINTIEIDMTDEEKQKHKNKYSQKIKNKKEEIIKNNI